MQIMHPSQVLRPKAAAEFLGISTRQLARFRDSGEFPEPTVILGPQMIGWTVKDCADWVEARKKAA